MIPVWIWTEATCEIAILSSVLPNRRGFTRLTCKGLTTMRVGKIRFPRVQRLAANVSPATVGCGWGAVVKVGILHEQNDTLNTATVVFTASNTKILKNVLGDVGVLAVKSS